MPATAYVGTEIDPKIVNAATKALDATGFTLSDIIKLTVAKIARDQCLPFDAEKFLQEEYGDEIPNALTRETIEKAERGEDVFYARDFDDLIRQLRS